MITRPYKPQDYLGVTKLLQKTGVESPVEPSDLRGPAAIVAEDENGMIVGFIWALVGLSTQAHVDFLAIDQKHRRGRLGIALLVHLDDLLLKAGVKRYTFYVEKDNHGFLEAIERHGKAMNTEKLRYLHFFRRQIQ